MNKQSIRRNDGMQAFNPYLPGWEYIPDGEPHVVLSERLCLLVRTGG